MKTLIDRMKTYTYNKGTVWFLSTPIQIHRIILRGRLLGGLFFCLKPIFDETLNAAGSSLTREG